MTPIQHPLCNDVLRAPAGDDNCNDLHICRENGEVWSFWRPNPEELAAIITGGAIALRVVAPTHPPLLLHVMTPEERITGEKTNDEIKAIYEANRARSQSLVTIMKKAVAVLAKLPSEKHMGIVDEFLDLMSLNTGKCEVVRDLPDYQPEPPKA
jgi:hypothetical protein